ncbi:serine protease [Lysinibacillus sp. NPDC096418]|uniref:serine protease n=1 Tax=Lysinibacillus sp. NPDC096418 TaxID=3364138 RepID=UPI0038060F44
MNYFILSQDELEMTDRQFPVLHKYENDYNDFIEKSIRLLSDSFTKLVGIFELRLPFKSVVLIDLPKLSRLLYWPTIPPKAAGLSAQTEYHLDGALKNLVINKALAAPYSIFKIDGIKEDYDIVNIEYAESIMRRAFRVIRLLKVQNEGEIWKFIVGRHSKKGSFP